MHVRFLLLHSTLFVENFDAKVLQRVLPTTVHEQLFPTFDVPYNE